MLKYLFGQFLRLPPLLLVLIGLASLPMGCSNPLNLLTGGGPNVAANVQAGKTNSQTLGTTKNMELKTNSGDINTTDAKVLANQAEKVVVNEVPPWVILLLILGWMFPSPAEIGRWLVSPFKRDKK